MTCNNPFIKDTLAWQAWNHWSGCSDKPKEEERVVHHEDSKTTGRIPRIGECCDNKCKTAEEFLKNHMAWG